MVRRLTSLAALLLCLAGPVPAQSVGDVLQIARFVLDMRGTSAGTSVAAAASDRIDAQMAQLIEAQLSARTMSDLLDDRLDAFDLRQTQRRIAGAALRLSACAEGGPACARDLDELDRLLRQTASELAASPLDAAVVALLERARGLNLAVLLARGAPEAERADLARIYARYFAALASSDRGASGSVAREAVLAEIARIAGLSRGDIALPPLTDAAALTDTALAMAGEALILTELRARFGGGLRPLDSQTGPALATVYFNCRLNRERRRFLDGRVDPFSHYLPLPDLVTRESGHRLAGPPEPGAPHALLWLGVSLLRTADGGLTAEAREYGLFDDGAAALVLPYGGEFYRNGAAREAAGVPLRGARTDAEVLSALGIFPWGPGPCTLTDSLWLTAPEAGFTALEAALEARAARLTELVRALAALEETRRLAAALSSG
jgi:hypothetical protein